MIKSTAVDRASAELQQFISEDHVLGFTSDSLHVVGKDRALKVAFVDANSVIPTAPPSPQFAVKTDDKAVTFTEITYQNLWDGIDLHYDKGHGIVRSTYTVKPGASVEVIKLEYNLPVRIEKNGSLKIIFDIGEWVESPPIAWQEIDGKREIVQVAFNITTDKQLGFNVGSYNQEYPLVIDPTLTWNTVLGASGHDAGSSIALDSNGNVIVVGTSSAPWGNPLNPHSGDSNSAFVAKLNASGGLEWHTYFGNSGGSSVALDDDDNIYVTGTSTVSWGSPIHPHTGSSADLFVAKMNSNGVLQWNTFYGGYTGSVVALALDNSRNIIIAGSSATSFGNPIIPHSGVGTADVLVAKLNEFGALQWNTFFGSGGRHDTTRMKKIAVDNSGNIFITGNSRGNWGNPIRPYSEPDTTNSPDVFVAKLNPDGALQWNTFLGGADGNRSFDTDSGISLDSSGNVYILGESENSWGSPINPHTGGVLEYNCFVAKLEPSGSLLWHSFYHWQGTQNYHDCLGRSIVVDGSGSIAFTGVLQSNMISNSYFIDDIVVAELNNAGVLQDSILLGTPLVGGDPDYRYNFSSSMEKDSSGSIYLTGSVNSDWDSNVNIGTAFPTSYYDILVAKVDGFSAGATLPIANAGPDQAVFVGDTVTLDGSQSTDPNGDLLTYSWSFSSIPTGSTAVLNDPSSLNPSFNVDAAGSYIVSLVVNDGSADSAVDTASISTINVAPVAHAGPDQAVFLGNTVTFDGSQSTDADGDLLTYLWSLTALPSGSSALLNDPTSVNPSFSVDVAGSYIASLVVNDGTVDSAADTVSISTINVAPVANAGPDQAVFVGDTVTFDGSQSTDADGNLLTYSWRLTALPSGSTAVLNDPASVNPSFSVDMAGSYVVSLIVNDGTVDSLPDTISISTINVSPTADAGADQDVFVGDLVTLNGSQSADPDGDALSFLWNFTSLPAGSSAGLNSPTSANPTFTSDRAGSYVVSLVVNDGTVDSAADTVSISTINVAPIADAGPDQAVFVGDSVSLDGSQSMDTDGDPLTYNWSFSSLPIGSTAVLDDPVSVNPTFNVDLAGTYSLSLVVNDGMLNSATDTITISTINVAPVAHAGPDQSALVGDTVVLDGSQSSDADGDSLTYSWSFTDQPAGSSVLLDDPSSINPNFNIDVAGMYILSLAVNDGTVDSLAASMTISAVTVNTAAIVALQDVLTTLNGFDISVFKKKRNLKALTNRLNTVIGDIEAHEIDKAIRKLERNILKRTNGCALNGGPDNNDWIMDCLSQAIVYSQIVAIIDLLETL